MRPLRYFAFAVAIIITSLLASAGDFRQKGFFEAYVEGYPQLTRNDNANAVADARFHYEPSYSTKAGLSLFASLETEIDSHHQVARDFTFSWFDRTHPRQLFSVRRLSAIYRKGPVTAEFGKQYVRWGKTDILVPTDRFSPRDYLNVIETEPLAVTAARVTLEKKSNTLDLVFAPRFTPSRTPLLDQRWFPVPPNATAVTLIDGGDRFPGGPQFGVRFGRTDKDIEYSASYYEGYNHLPVFNATFVSLAPPAVSVLRTYPRLRAFGGDLVFPTSWFTIKSEAEFLHSSTRNSDSYILYVVQLERQWKEWLFVGGYTGDAVTRRGAAFAFPADRGLARSFVGRASLTIDANRNLAVEGVLRQNGEGRYGKVEYSQLFGQHWRATLSAVAIGGAPADFLGQYNQNSFAGLSLRYSF